MVQVQLYQTAFMLKSRSSRSRPFVLENKFTTTVTHFQFPQSLISSPPININIINMRCAIVLSLAAAALAAPAPQVIAVAPTPLAPVVYAIPNPFAALGKGVANLAGDFANIGADTVGTYLEKHP